MPRDVLDAVDIRQVRQAQNVDVDVHVDIESHPVGVSTPPDQQVIFIKISKSFFPYSRNRPVHQIEGEENSTIFYVEKKNTISETN